LVYGQHLPELKVDAVSVSLNSDNAAHTTACAGPLSARKLEGVLNLSARRKVIPSRGYGAAMLGWM
jgi:hypothetical protein